MYELAVLPLLKATWETIYMVFIASFFGILLGLALGILLFISSGKNNKNNLINQTLGFSINLTRSIPFIILMIAIIPLTHLLVGTTIGINAAIVPLSIAAIPFFARLTENALKGLQSGLIETADSMGASTWQTITKILIPESLPTLIRGATLTIVALIGYSAMAGSVGGGGLGELAINYGYQRFDTVVMLETVIILIIMVQAIQFIGDYLAKSRSLKGVYLASILLWVACITYQVWPSQFSNASIIRVGIIGGEPEKVLAVAKDVAQKQYGINLQIVTFSDYVQPNTALNNGSIDANIFQHVPYLEGQMKAHHYTLSVIAKTFVYPMGMYSIKIKHLSELKNGSIVAIPNDPSNGGRALLLLQKTGLIRLKPGTSVFATVKYIESNKLNLRFKLLDAAQLPRVLGDADLVAITNDFVGPAHLSIKDAVIKEGSDSPYANIIVVREQDKNKPIFEKLINVMHSTQVLKTTEGLFPNGAAIPAWK
jgi:D-methionine transport system substrate-binding protein